MGAYDCSETTFIALAAETLYDMVADITRMGEWSPVTTWGKWNEGHVPGRSGSRFTGHNEANGNVWETTCVVVAADRGREFAFEVTPLPRPQALAFFGPDADARLVRWTYSFMPQDSGTQVTESWLYLEDGRAYLPILVGDEFDADLAKRRETAINGMRETLARLKNAAERGQVSSSQDPAR